MSTRRTLTPIVLPAVLALWIPNFGLIDLIDGLFPFVDENRNAVLDAGWGAVFGLMLPLALLGLLPRRRFRIAGVQAIVLIALALAVAGVAGDGPGYIAVGALLAVPALPLARDPGLGALTRLTPAPRPALLLVAAIGAAPWFVYATRMSRAGREHLPPLDARSNGLHHWPVMAAMAVALVLLAVLAAFARDGWPLPASAAALGSLAWGLSSSRFPDAAGGAGRGWGVAAIAWAAALVVAVTIDGRRKGTGPP